MDTKSLSLQDKAHKTQNSNSQTAVVRKRDVGTQIPDVAHNVRRFLNDSDVVKVGHVYFL